MKMQKQRYAGTNWQDLTYQTAASVGKKQVPQARGEPTSWVPANGTNMT
jgi:hypothetical protein